MLEIGLKTSQWLGISTPHKPIRYDHTIRHINGNPLTFSAIYFNGDIESKIDILHNDMIK